MTLEKTIALMQEHFWLNIKADPDNPSFSEAMSGPHAVEYEQAMNKEIRQLIQIKAWKYVL